jgi:hypothetical protein
MAEFLHNCEAGLLDYFGEGYEENLGNTYDVLYISELLAWTSIR